jgi:trehalose-phosphatase
VTVPLLPIPPAVATRLVGTPCVVMLDVDGTLAPIAPRPEAAEVPPDTKRVIAALVERDGVHVVLVSGRAANDARRLVSVDGVWVIGNHGFEVLSPNGEEVIDPEVASTRPFIAQAAGRIGPQVEYVPGVILENKGWTLSIHYRLADPAVLPRLRATVEEAALPLGLRVTDGKKVIEVRPSTRIDKGTAVLSLGTRLGGLGEGGSLIFIGDDRTDEDAFRALREQSPDALTVRVVHDEDVQTSAEFALRDTAEVQTFLERLLELRS